MCCILLQYRPLPGWTVCGLYVTFSWINGDSNVSGLFVCLFLCSCKEAHQKVRYTITNLSGADRIACIEYMASQMWQMWSLILVCWVRFYIFMACIVHFLIKKTTGVNPLQLFSLFCVLGRKGNHELAENQDMIIKFLKTFFSRND